MRDRCGIDDEELAETAFRSWAAAFRSLRENVLVVPVTVLVLDDLDERVVGNQSLDEDAPVEKITRIPAHGGLASGDHDHTGAIGNLDRIHRHTGENRTADGTEVQAAFHRRCDLIDRDAADPLASGLRAGDEQHAAHRTERHQQHGDEARGKDQSAATDHVLRTPARSRRRK